MSELCARCQQHRRRRSRSCIDPRHAGTGPGPSRRALGAPGGSWAPVSEKARRRRSRRTWTSAMLPGKLLHGAQGWRGGGPAQAPLAGAWQGSDGLQADNTMRAAHWEPLSPLCPWVPLLSLRCAAASRRPGRSLLSNPQSLWSSPPLNFAANTTPVTVLQCLITQWAQRRRPPPAQSAHSRQAGGRTARVSGASPAPPPPPPVPQ